MSSYRHLDPHALQFPANGTKPHTHRYARHGE